MPCMYKEEIMATSKEKASLFLMQSTLGADYELIEKVANQGTDEWLEEQLNSTVEDNDTFYSRANAIWQDFKAQAIEASGDDGSGNIIGAGNATLPYNFYFRMAWWHRVLSKANPNASDDTTLLLASEKSEANLVRHKVAQALSEIIVISDKSILELNGLSMAQFYDILYKNAFGNYADILYDVSMHPAMGIFLTHINNQKENLSKNIHPDENYAREIMQLFTIGLNELNEDGSEKLDSNGNFIPTYTNDDIKQLAKVFTGIKANSYYYEWPEQISGFTNGYPINLANSTNRAYITIPYVDMLKPMVEESSLHDVSAKSLLNEKVNIDANGSLQSDVKKAVNDLVAHPNTAPFIAKKLIQQLVTSNPSSSYIQAVAEKFGTKGNLKAVIKEILTNSEAMSANAKKLKSPACRFTQLLRAFDVHNASGKFYFRGDTVDYSLNNHVLSSPTVFNFYLPNFAPHGAIENAKKVAPEFQLHNNSTSISFENVLYDICFSEDSHLALTVPTKIDKNAYYKTSDTTLQDDKLKFDFSKEKALLEDDGSNVDEVISRVSLILTAEENSDINGTIKNVIDEKIGYSSKDYVMQSIVYLLVSSPQFAIQMKRS